LRVPVHLTSRDSLRIFDLADIWAARTGADVQLVSGNDHIHTRGSAHYEGEAVDFHSSDLDGLAAMLRAAGYRVLWKVRGHYSHVHAECVVAGRPLAPSLVQERQARGPFLTIRSHVGG
jgi:hypothetical protein